MATFDYFGFRYEINEDDKTAVLEWAPEARGKVFVPKEVEKDNKKYTVVGFGGHVIPVYKWEGGERETDGRKKNYWKVEPHKVVDYHANLCPFSRYYYCIDDVPDRKVTSVVLPDTITTLGIVAFKKCEALEEVQLSKSITKIPSGCFDSCKKLKHIELHEGITQIDYHAFAGCEALTEITIPSSVKSIDDGAFGNAVFSRSGLTVVNILNEEGAVLIHPKAFTDRAKINYLGKNGAKKAATPKTENAKEPAKGATIDLEKLIQAALADGVVTDKERAILIKKVKEADGDTDEFEMLLDARIYEAQQKSGKAKPEPKPAAKAEPKPAKTATPKAEPKQAAEKPANAADKEGRQMWVERSSEQLVSLGEKMLNIVNSAATTKYELRYTNSYIGFGANGKPSNFAWFIPKKKEIQVNIKVKQDPDLDKTLNDKFAGNWAYKGGTYSVNLSCDIEALKAMLLNAEQQFKK